MKKRLLIIPCSKTKIWSEIPLPAIERYNGYFFKILKKNRKSNMDVLILSAKYGLLNEDEKTLYYDKKMNLTIARELEIQVYNKFFEDVDLGEYKEICVNLGRYYIDCFSKTLSDIKESFMGEVITFHGGLGERGCAMKNWLIN